LFLFFSQSFQSKFFLYFSDGDLRCLQPAHPGELSSVIEDGGFIPNRHHPPRLRGQHGEYYIWSSVLVAFLLLARCKLFQWLESLMFILWIKLDEYPTHKTHEMWICLLKSEDSIAHNIHGLNLTKVNLVCIWQQKMVKWCGYLAWYGHVCSEYY
jgi:hypothetical protein